jgi:hypothetical protein
MSTANEVNQTPVVTNEVANTTEQNPGAAAPQPDAANTAPAKDLNDLEIDEIEVIESKVLA